MDKLIFKSYAMSKNSKGPLFGSQAQGLPLHDQVLLEQKVNFVAHCHKIQHIASKKYEALTNFMRDQANDTFFVDTIDSNMIRDLLL